MNILKNQLLQETYCIFGICNKLFSIVCSSLVLFLLKSLQNVISIQHLDENSTVVIIMLYYITDRELLKKLLIERITKMTTYLNSSV